MKRNNKNRAIIFFNTTLLGLTSFYILNSSVGVDHFFVNPRLPDNGTRILSPSEIKKEQKIDPLELKKIKKLSSYVASKNPAISLVFGYSVQGRPIEGYIFGSGEETTLLMGAIHGNEKSSAYLLKQLVAEISSGTVTVGSGKRVIIIPIVNPDGYSGGLVKVNFDNVNLNLNFDTSEWQPRGGDSDLSAGSAPFSEPESRVIRDMVEKYSVKKMISFHAQGGLVNPEFTHKPSEDLASLYSRISGYRYYEDKSWDYFGTSTKWFIEHVGGPAITVELTTNTGADWAINKPALAYLMK